MSKSHCLFLFSFLITTVTSGAEFSSIHLSGWNKEELSNDHLRFTRPENKKLVLHLQVDNFDPTRPWEEKTLAGEIKKMETLRKTVSRLLGTSDYKISQYSLEKENGAKATRVFPVLSLTGSYRRLDRQLIHFSEHNIYYNKHFLQLKFISEDILPDQKEREAILKEINPSKLEIE